MGDLPLNQVFSLSPPTSQDAANASLWTTKEMLPDPDSSSSQIPTLPGKTWWPQGLGRRGEVIPVCSNPCKRYTQKMMSPFQCTGSVL